MIPIFIYPLALLALASLPVLAAIYIFRSRFRRRPVSSLMLWRFRIQPRLGGSRRHRLQLPLIFFLELIVLVLLVTASAGPQLKLPHHGRPLVVVLDDSISMRAVSDNQSAQTRAGEFLEKLLQRYQPPYTRLILAGKEPRIAGPPIRTRAELVEQLKQWQCWSAAAALDQAVGLASELGRGRANILVLTDHAPTDANVTGNRLHWCAFGVPAANVALVNATRSPHGDQDRCMLEVYNGSVSVQRPRLTIYAATNTVQTMQLELGPRDRQRLVFNIPASVPLLRAELEHDALAEDNLVQLLSPLRKRVRVRVALTNSVLAELVERTLDATGLRAAVSENPELVIHQLPVEQSGSGTWTLQVVQPTDPTVYIGPFVVDAAHPLAQGLSLHGVVWVAQPMTNQLGEVPIVLAVNVPLLSAREDALGRRHITLNFEPDASTLQHTPDWPIMFWNILNWRASQQLGLQENNVRLGGEVLVHTTGEPVVVGYPDGTVKTVAGTAGQVSVDTPMPGLYVITIGRVTNSLAVNLLTADESNLSACKTGTWGTWREDAERQLGESSLVWVVVLAALIGLVVHLFLLATGKGDA